MPKLFKKIADNINGLYQVYNDSTTTSNVLTNIQSIASANPVDAGYVNNDVRRIEPVYYLYTGQWAPSKTQAQLTKNQLQLGTTIQRKRLSDFYNWFPSTNTLIQAANNGKADNGTLVEIKPYGKGAVDTETMKQDSRQVPIVSGPRDETRIGGFLKTNPGILFLAMQQTLQGGNTFKQSRKYDPTSVLLATGKYTLASLTNPLERVDRGLDIDTANAGRLQRETQTTAVQNVNIKYQGGSSGGSSRTSLLGRVASTAASRLVQDIVNRTNINVFGNKINLGQLGRTLDTYAQTLQSIQRATDVGNATLKPGETAYDELFNQGYPFVNDPANGQTKYQTERDGYVQRAQSVISNIKGKLHSNPFTEAYDPNNIGGSRDSLTYNTAVVGIDGMGTMNGVTSARYMKDPMNYTDDAGISGVSNPNDLDGKYADIDFIKFKIVVPNVFDGGVSFRAFVKDIKHNAKGDFEEQRYIGRPERFIVYKGMNRSMTFTLYLVAFTQKELSAMWTRANMLNKLVYPVGTGAGYMTPPIIKMTLGNIIKDQPGYVTDISMNLEGFPWDIDSEVTNVVEMNVTFNIIEKNYITQDYNNISDVNNTGFLFAEQVLDNAFGENINTAAQTAANVMEGIKIPDLPDPLASLDSKISNALNIPFSNPFDQSTTTPPDAAYTDAFGYEDNTL